MALEERATPQPAADEVLVRIHSVGVCGSDVHYYEEGRIADFVVETPLILGHECSGVIVAVGDDVDPARIGQRVAIEPQRGVSIEDDARRAAGSRRTCGEQWIVAFDRAPSHRNRINATA